MILRTPHDALPILCGVRKGGQTVSLNGARMANQRGGRGLGEQFPGSGGAQAPSFCAKGHLAGIKLQKTPSGGSGHSEGDTEAQGTGGQRTRRHHPRPAGDWAPGRGRKEWGVGREVDRDTQRQEGTLGQENPGSNRDLGTGLGRKECTAHERTFFGPSFMRGKRRRAVAAVRRERRPGRWSLRDRPREVGKEAGAKKNRSDVYRQNMWGNRAQVLGGGRKGMNDPENSRIHFGVEGLDKSVIEKRKSLRIEPSLTGAR